MSRKALIVQGGWQGHTPKESAELFAPLLQAEGFEVEISDTLASFEEADQLSELSLIVPIWTMGTIEAAQAKNLIKAVHDGVGLAGFHGGMIDAFRSNSEYQFMTGGQFVAHPGGIIPTHHVKITDKQHEITKGISDFDLLNTEQYYMHVDPGNHVLATSTLDGGHGDTSTYIVGTVMPYCWTRSWGKGNVFAAAWGHTHEDFKVEEAREIVLRGMKWAAR